METYDYKQESNTLEISMRGRYDTVISMNLEDILLQKIEKALKSSTDQKTFVVTINLAEVEYVSSTFMRICLKAAKMLSQGNFQVTNANPLIKETFAVSGFNAMLKII